MIIDCHNHILAAGAYPGYKRFIQEMCLGYFRSLGKLPTDRIPVDDDWQGLEYLWEPIDPEAFIKDHDEAGIQKSVILGVAPSDYTRYEIRGTVDLAGVTDVPGAPSIDKVNDYIASLVRKYPQKFIGFAAVNPRYRGAKAAVKELERAILELGLTGLKLYPTYDHYSPDDRDLAFPVFQKAQELGIPVMIHQSSTPVIDAPLKYCYPSLLDDAGRHFPELKVIVAHAGLPWIEECLVLVAKHPNFGMDLSYANSTMSRQEMYQMLMKCKAYGLPWDKIYWGTDYPGFEFPQQLLPKFQTVNEEAEKLGLPEIPQAAIDGMLGKNFARLIGLQT